EAEEVQNNSSLALFTASCGELFWTSSASALARDDTRRRASFCTLLAMTIDKARDTARTTTRRVATALTAMRAGTDRRADVMRTVPRARAAAPRVQSAAPADPRTETASATAIRTRAIHSERRATRSS